MTIVKERVESKLSKQKVVLLMDRAVDDGKSPKAVVDIAHFTTTKIDNIEQLVHAYDSQRILKLIGKKDVQIVSWVHFSVEIFEALV